MTWKKYEDAVEKGPGAIFWRVALFFIVAGIGLSVVGFVLNPFKQAARITEKTLDADNVIYNYEWFKRQFRSVGAIEKKIGFQQERVDEFADSAGQRKEWDRMDKVEHYRLTSIVTGLKQQRADMVAEYNARSSMANRNIFMGGDCPETIEQ